MLRILIKSACHLSKCKTKKHISCGKRRAKATKQFLALYVHFSISQYPKTNEEEKSGNYLILSQEILRVSSHEIICEKKWKCFLVLIHWEPPWRLAYKSVLIYAYGYAYICLSVFTHIWAYTHVFNLLGRIFLYFEFYLNLVISGFLYVAVSDAC